MKISSKILIIAALSTVIAGSVYCAETMDETGSAPAPQKTAAASAKTAVPAAAAAAKPAAASVRKSDVSFEAFAEIKAKLEDLTASVRELKDGIKILQEKNTETSGMASDLAAYKNQLDDMETKYGEDGKKISGMEKQFAEMGDTLKGRVDKMQSWDDILAVLKKEISDNEGEIARLKKEINGLKKQYGEDDNIFNTIIQWPYAGITALVISLIAFVTAVVKK
jgi:chromosome segregation ATPase